MVLYPNYHGERNIKEKRCLLKLHPQNPSSTECTEVYWESYIKLIGTHYISSEVYGKMPNYIKGKQLDLTAFCILFLSAT